MIRIILDAAAMGFEQDIRELVQAFYPGEEFEIRTPEGVHLTSTTQEEKNALKQAQETGTVTAVNKKSTKNRARMLSQMTPEGVEEASLREIIDVKGAALPLTGVRKEDKSLLKAHLYAELAEKTGKQLPWGDLTGIRPVSLVSPMLEALGHPAAPEDIRRIKEYLTQEYCVRGEKLDLMVEIAVREQRILDRIRQKTGRSYREGWSLYIGIPFCPTRCLYCSFLSNTIDHWEKRLGDYMENLRQELRFTVQYMCGVLHRPLQTIYIGGGTPTALNAHWLQVLMDLVHEACGTANVSLLKTDRSAAEAAAWRETGENAVDAYAGTAEGAAGMPGIVEFTVEAGRPDSITEEKLAILKAAGVNRISVNPQTFCQKTLDLIGRKHSVESVIEKYHMARRLGFDNINMDIILGLPGEKLPEVTHTLCEIARLHPESLTVHSLAVKRTARLTLERDLWSGVYRAGDEQEILLETQQPEDGAVVYPEITRMMLASEYAAQLLGMQPYYLYRQKNMAGNLENVGYCTEGKECLYNILMMEEKHTVVGCGAGTSTKAVLPSGDGDLYHKRVERCDNGKSIPEYLDHIEKFIERKKGLFSLLEEASSAGV